MKDGFVPDNKDRATFKDSKGREFDAHLTWLSHMRNESEEFEGYMDLGSDEGRHYGYIEISDGYYLDVEAEEMVGKVELEAALMRHKEAVTEYVFDIMQSRAEKAAENRDG